MVDTSISQSNATGGKLQYIGANLIELAQVIVRLEELALNRGPRLTYRQHRILKHVQAGRTTSAELSGIFGVTPPTLSETIDALVRRGLITRAQKDTDRRANTLAVTDAGHQLLARSEEIESILSHELLADLDQRGVEHLGTIVEAILPVARERLLSRRGSARRA